MNTNYKTNNTSKWLRNCLTGFCLAVFLLAGLLTANAQSGNLPILFFSTREDGRNRNFGMNTDGSNQTPIGNPDSRGFFARYSPDGQKITYVRSDVDANTPFGFRQQIFVMNADGTNQINISNDLSNHHNAPAWSPDGQKIVFVQVALDFTGSELWIMDADGSNQQLVYSNPGAFGAWYPGVSPDGGTIAFTNDADGDDEIFLINIDGTNLRQLTDNAAHDYGVDWSPDGTKIAFNRERGGKINHPGANNGNSNGGNGNIYVMNADGTNEIRLTKHGNQEFYPIFSPDGSQIVFTRRNGYSSGNYDIYSMNSNGGNVLRLTHETSFTIASDWGATQTLADLPLKNAGVTPSFIVISPADAQAQTGKTYGEWSAIWWQYGLETPLENNPFYDATGANCNYGQSGSVFFLVSTSGGTETRNECVVPAGKTLFFPLLGTVGYIEMTDPMPETALRAFIQGWAKSTKTLQANIDGQDVTIDLNPKSTPLRTLSPDGFFTITAPDNPIFGVPGQSYNAVSDGFYLMVAPLSPGAHTITFGGNTRNFSSYVTYNLVVEP